MVHRSAQLALLGAGGLALPGLAFTQVSDVQARELIAASALVGVLGFFLTRYLIPPVTSKTAARGICGKDLNKKGTPAGDVPIPEAAGLAVGCAFLLCVICFELLHYYDVGGLVSWVRSGFQGPPPGRDVIADAWLVDYNAALATIGFMLFLGFADDVLDIRWRVKILLPLFAALPLLVAYSGGTGVAVPKPLQALLHLPSFLELGVLYKVRVGGGKAAGSGRGAGGESRPADEESSGATAQAPEEGRRRRCTACCCGGAHVESHACRPPFTFSASGGRLRCATGAPRRPDACIPPCARAQAYMVLLVIFCTNSINILAGVNGLEAGQTFVVACAILTLNLASVAGFAAGSSQAVKDGHLFSAYLMLPLAGVTFGLLTFNWCERDGLGAWREQRAARGAGCGRWKAP